MTKLAHVLLALVLFNLATVTARAEDEPAIAGDATTLPYLRAVHAKVHPLWAETFLPMAAARYPKDHPINGTSRRVELEVVLSADGALYDVRVVEASGSPDFDAAATDVVRTAGAFASPPADLLSEDGKVHLRWVFARDRRRCAGLAVTKYTLPLADAVAALVSQQRDPAAVERLQAASDDERMAAMDAFARAWLFRMQNDKPIAVVVAAAHAAAGDARGADVLRKAVDVAGTAADDLDAAHGLAALRIPICPLIRASFEKLARPRGSATPAAPLNDEHFAQLLRSKQHRRRVLNLLLHGASDACLSFAVALAKDRSAETMERAFAIQSLGHSDGAEAQAALRSLTQDPNDRVRSIAIRIEARPGAGRGAVFRLTPLLRDKSLLLRAAAASALVRVGGEEVLPQLFLVYKEKDPSIYGDVASELANLSGAASAEMLGRFLKKDNPAIRVAAARALAARHDEHAEKVRASLAASDDGELQLLSGLASSKEKRDAAVRAAAVGEFALDYDALLRGSARIVAADWLLARFAELSPSQIVLYLGWWLDTRPKAP